MLKIIKQELYVCQLIKYVHTYLICIHTTLNFKNITLKSIVRYILISVQFKNWCTLLFHIIRFGGFNGSQKYYDLFTNEQLEMIAQCLTSHNYSKR